MKKNLKKVISAVVALALSVSSVVALAATPSFTDVADTANYAEAVNTLAALGIVTGYGDGTFKPEDNITRAEVTTMVVAAINATEQAEGMMGTTQFSDVQDEATRWASGYINVGVANGFISGFAEDGTFRPSENVTYAQIVSMLIRALEYEDYADYLGGWPNGYLSLGQSTGVTSGVSLNANDVVTRGQVAMLINNFLDTPKVEVNGFSYTDTGAIRPNIEVQDGKNGTYYKTPLTEYFRIYILEGAVVETNRTNPQRDADRVLFQIQKVRSSDQYESITGENINNVNLTQNTDGTYNYTQLEAYIGETDAANYLNTYAVAYMELNDSDEWVIRHFIPSGRNRTFESRLSLLDDEEYDFTGTSPYLRFFATADATRSTRYSLSSGTRGGFRLYVNGREVEEPTTTDFETYILNNPTGDIELIDQYASGSAADGYYDIINVTYYAIGQVDTVSTSTGRITFSEINVRGNNLTLDEESNDVTFHIYKNGSEITLADIRTDDILTISYDVTQDFQSSHYYEIYVSSDTAEGQYTSYSNSDETVTIGGTAYEFATGDFAAHVKSLKLADEYVVYLDAFGRIYTYETSVSSAKLAILDRYTKSSADDYYRATLYTSDGSSGSYEVNNTRVSIDGKTGAELDKYLLTKIYDAGDNGIVEDSERTNANKLPIQDRVVSYKINSSGIITSLTFETGKGGPASYNSNTNAVGSVRMSESSKIIDATEYNDQDQQTSYLAMASLSDFIDDVEYEAYGYGERFSDNTYPLVLVVKGEGAYTEETRFAVISDDMPGQGSNEDGDYIYTFKAFYEGAEVDISTVDEADLEVKNIDDSTLDPKALRKGDVIVFQGGTDNVKQIDVVFRGSQYIGDYETNTVAKLLKVGDSSGLIGIPADVGTSDGLSKWTTNWKTNSDQNVQLVAGPIVEKNSGYFTIGKVATAAFDKDGNVVEDPKTDADDVVYNGLYTDRYGDSTDEDGVLEVSFADNVTVVSYDYYYSEKARLSTGTSGNIVASTIGNSQYLGDDQNIVPWDTLKADGAPINFAFAMLVDDEAVCVFVINAA